MTPDEYQQAIGEIARSATMPDDAAAKMEAALAQAFESTAVASEEPAAAGSRDPALHRVSFGALAAAAALVITVGAGVWYAVRPAVTSNDVTGRSTPSKAGLKASTTETAGLKASTTETAGLKASTTETAGLKASTTETAGLKASTTETAGLKASTIETAGRHSARKLPPVIRPEGFVAVPAAAGLPQFESGVIVRMSLPVTALPSYGVDISPASSDQPVEADVLVGQDGRARAIRLVNTSRSQQ